MSGSEDCFGTHLAYAVVALVDEGLDVLIPVFYLEALCVSAPRRVASCVEASGCLFFEGEWCVVASAEDVHGVDAAVFDGFGEGGTLFLYEFGCDAVSELPEVNMAVDDWVIPEFFEIQLHRVLVFFGFINYARWVWNRVEETMAHGTKCHIFVV